MRRLIPALAACALVVLPATAAAGPPGTWTRMTGTEGGAHTTDQLGLVRTADGALQMAYTVDPQSGNDDILHKAISKDAQSVSGPETVLVYPALNNAVAMVPGPGGGLRIFFGGLDNVSIFDGFMRTMTAGADGKTWSDPVAASNNTAQGHPVYAGAGLSAAVGKDGNPISAWGESQPQGNGYHLGLDPSAPDASLGGACCVLEPNVAVDSSTGQVVIAWGAGVATSSTEAQILGGAHVTAPNSAAFQLQDRTAVTGRLGAPGVYLAYTQGTNQFSGTPALLHVDPAAKAKPIPKQKGGQHIAIAAAPQGRLWLLWARSGNVYALRTNAAATKFGAIVKVKPPAGYSTIYRLTGEASLGPLDLLGLFQNGGADIGYFHQRILPGLTLTASPTNVKKGHKVTFKVTDAGDPIKGAKVSIKFGSVKKTGTTSATGKVKLTVPAGASKGTRTATAAKSGYAKGTAKVKVKR
jgi:hypothetical protein